MTAFRIRMIVAVWGVSVLSGLLVPPAELAAQGATSEEQGEKPVAKVPTNGEDLLRQIREASEPILAEMAEKHGYRMEADQVIRRIAPPFPELRVTYYKVGHPTQARAIRTPADAMVFAWNGERLTGRGMTFGSGYAIAGVIDHALKIKSQDIEGPAEFLSQRLEGDWVIRPDSPEDKVIEQLQTILQKEFHLPVQLAFVKRVRTVYVARGKYEYTPVKREESDPNSTARQPAQIDEIQIYGKTLGSNGAGGGTGDFKEFLGWVGRWIEMPLINEVKEPPEKQVGWTLNQRSPFTEIEYKEDHDPETVLKNVAAQTGLTFKKEYRAIRRLVIEPLE